MAVTELILGAPQAVKIGEDAQLEILPAGVVEVDAAISETHEVSNDITQFPVESGSQISDHIRPQPRRFTVEGIVTNTPIVFGGGITTSPTRAEEADDKFLAMIDGGALVSVVSTLREYVNNMAVESYVVRRNATHGNAIMFTLNLRELFTAEVATVPAPEPAAGQAGTAGETNVGEQGTGAASQSAASSIGDALSGSVF